MFAGDDESLCRYHLSHQLYAESVIRDIGRGGLPQGFLDPLDRVRDLIQEQFRSVHAYRRERETVGVVRALSPRMKPQDTTDLLERCTSVEAVLEAGGEVRAVHTVLIDQLRAG